jgi:hypothetical protein
MLPNKQGMRYQLTQIPAMIRLVVAAELVLMCSFCNRSSSLPFRLVHLKYTLCITDMQRLSFFIIHYV